VHAETGDQIKNIKGNFYEEVLRSHI
jgi:hypothetical protein